MRSEAILCFVLTSQKICMGMNRAENLSAAVTPRHPRSILGVLQWIATQLKSDAACHDMQICKLQARSVSVMSGPQGHPSRNLAVLVFGQDEPRSCNAILCYARASDLVAFMVIIPRILIRANEPPPQGLSHHHASECSIKFLASLIIMIGIFWFGCICC